MHAVLIGTAITLVALALRLALDPIGIEDNVVFATFVVAIMFAALLGDTLAGLVVLGGGAVAACIFWLDIPSDAAAGRYASALALAVYLATGTLNLLTVTWLRRTLIALAESEQRARELNRELHHRIGNLSAVYQSVVAQTLRQAGQHETLRALDPRLRAIAKAQTWLETGADAPDDVLGILADVLCDIAPGDARLLMVGPPAHVPAALRAGFVLMIQELATNAVRHGAWSNDSGVVNLQWNLADGTLDLEWTETGGPPVVGPVRSGVGLRFVQAAVPSATVDLDVESTGLRAAIKIPVARCAIDNAPEARDAGLS